MTLTKSALDGQFILCQDSKLIPQGWSVREKGSWILATHPSLPVVDMLNDRSMAIGWIVGHAISLETELLSDKVVFDSTASNSKFHDKQIEDQLYSLGGRFAAIVLEDGIERIYLDPGGSLAAVYATDSPIIASTQSLFPLENYEEDSELIRMIGFPEGGIFFPGRLTPRRGIRRLLPNHYLDLSKGEVFRHWPKHDQLAVENDVDAAIKNIVVYIKNNLNAVAKKYDLHMSLTAGQDSRSLLACAREILDKVLFFTFEEKRVTVDSQIAGLIVNRFALHHKFISYKYATEVEKQEWLFRTGQCVSGALWKIHPTLHQLDKQRALLPGVGGGLGRAFFYRESDESLKVLETNEILDRFGYPRSKRLAEPINEWLSEVSSFPIPIILDLLFLEIRKACLDGPHQYGGDDSTICHLWPLCHRQIFGTMINLPTDYKREKRLGKDICRLEWPELLEFPINSYYGNIKYIKRFEDLVQTNYYRSRRALKRILVKSGL